MPVKPPPSIYVCTGMGRLYGKCRTQQGGRCWRPLLLMSLQGGKHGKSLRTLIRTNSEKLFIAEEFLGSRRSVFNTIQDQWSVTHTAWGGGNPLQGCTIPSHQLSLVKGGAVRGLCTVVLFWARSPQGLPALSRTTQRLNSKPEMESERNSIRVTPRPATPRCSKIDGHWVWIVYFQYSYYLSYAY